jgi:hypothetical protein
LVAGFTFIGVFENRVLRTADEWRKLHGQGIRNLYSSLNVTKVIKSRRRRAVHVARMGAIRNAYKISTKVKWRQNGCGRRV